MIRQLSIPRDERRWRQWVPTMTLVSNWTLLLDMHNSGPWQEEHPVKAGRFVVDSERANELHAKYSVSSGAVGFAMSPSTLHSDTLGADGSSGSNRSVRRRPLVSRSQAPWPPSANRPPVRCRVCPTEACPQQWWLFTTRDVRLRCLKFSTTPFPNTLTPRPTGTDRPPPGGTVVVICRVCRVTNENQLRAPTVLNQQITDQLNHQTPRRYQHASVLQIPPPYREGE